VAIEVGDRVRLTGGGYKGSHGVVESLEGELVKVKVDSFGAPMSVRVEPNQLEKVNG